MDIVRSGLILNTENYLECVSFYRDVFGLRILFRDQRDDSELTCFEHGSSYLMVETGGIARPGGKMAAEDATKLRFNVADIEAALDTLRAHGIDAHIVTHDWGRTIDLHDPDGNRIGIRDDTTFARSNAG